MTYLQLQGLTKRYGDQLAVDDLCLSVERGEFVSLLGPSGCGKTTTLQMIAGFVEPSSGAITLDGQDLLAVRPNRRGLGIVFQSYALFPHLTAARNIAFGLEMLGLSRQERDRRVSEALALVGLAGLAARYPKRMSGGQQQRVALARALVIKPSVLLLDEPLSNLDAKLREDMQMELRSIQRRVGTTTILVTHDQSEAMALSDRVVVMNKGRAEQIARPDAAYANPASAFVAQFLGKSNFLPATVSGASGAAILHVGGLALPWSGAEADGAVKIGVRPERIRFASALDPAIEGRVLTRIFQGAHWLFEVETELGSPLTVIRQNDGSVMPEEGAPVRLSFGASDAMGTVALRSPEPGQ